MRATINEDVFNASMGKEFERVFDQWGVCEREEALIDCFNKGALIGLCLPCNRLCIPWAVLK